MNDGFTFKSNGMQYNLKPLNNGDNNLVKSEHLDNVTNQIEIPTNLEEILTNSELTSKFLSQIEANPRSFSEQEVDLILKYSQVKGKHILSIMFKQFESTGIHQEYIQHIVDHCIDKQDYDLLIVALMKKQLTLSPQQQQKLGDGAIKNFNVGAIIEHLDILQLSREQKNSIVKKHMSAMDLKMVIQYFDELEFDEEHRIKLVDKAIASKNYKEIISNLQILQPNAEQLNLLIDKSEPRFWEDWGVVGNVCYYNTSLINIDKFEQKVIEAKRLGQYFELHSRFKRNVDQMCDLFIASMENTSGNVHTFDYKAFYVLMNNVYSGDPENEGKLMISKEKLNQIVRIGLENGQDFESFKKYDHFFKFDATFLPDIKARNGFDKTTMRTQFELTPTELKDYFEQNCKYDDSKYLQGADKVLNLDTINQTARDTIFTQFNNEFIIMDEANRRNNGKLDPKMARISQAFGGTTDIEGYLLGRCILDGDDQKTLAKLKNAGLTETGESGLDQLKKIFSEFKTQLLKSEMTIAELKNIREKLNVPLFQHYFVNFTRQTQGQFGDKTADSLLQQMDYLIKYYEKTGTSDLEKVGELKEGYENANININIKSKQEFPLNPEVTRQLEEYKTNMKKALELFKDAKKHEKPTYRLFGFVKTGKELIYGLCDEAQKELDAFDPEKIIAANDARIIEAKESKDEKKVKINDPEKVLIGLQQKANRLNDLRTLVSAKTESGKEYISPKVILENWVQIFSELSKYKNILEVKNFLQQMLFAEFVYDKGMISMEGEWTGEAIDNIKDNLDQLELLNPQNPHLDTLEKTLDIVTHLINQEFWKKQIFEERNTIIQSPEKYLSDGPGIYGPNNLLQQSNRRLPDKLHSLKSNLTDEKKIKKFEEAQKLPISRAAKDMDNILGLNAIKDFVDNASQHQKASGETVKWNLQPARGYLLEVSGKLCDACWADKYASVNQSFPDMTFVNILSQTEEGETKLEGGFMLMEVNGENGEKVLTIRGLNPLLASIDNLIAESLVESIADFTKATATRIGAIPAIVIDDHTGGSCTNRQAIQAFCQYNLAPTLHKLPVADDNKSNFNGYNISNWTYKLDKRIESKDGIDKDHISS